MGTPAAYCVLEDIETHKKLAGLFAFSILAKQSLTDVILVDVTPFPRFACKRYHHGVVCFLKVFRCMQAYR